MMVTLSMSKSRNMIHTLARFRTFPTELVFFLPRSDGEGGILFYPGACLSGHNKHFCRISSIKKQKILSHFFFQKIAGA